ncbi:uncharacterized protein [Eucyclogobius newberryi]|uniref:uncharacterized protein n=1 Tax=Eucyclogobius newberryi TaxID=166745 RepID=UPI003B5933C8
MAAPGPKRRRASLNPGENPACCMHILDHCEENSCVITQTRWDTFRKIAKEWISLKGRENNAVLHMVHMLDSEYGELETLPCYHPSCYKRFTDKRQLLCAKQRLEKQNSGCTESAAAGPSPERLCLKSEIQGSSSILPEVCLVCKKKERFTTVEGTRAKEKLAKAETENCGRLREAAELKHDETILMQIRGKDCVAVEARYHYSCYKAYTRFLSENQSETGRNDQLKSRTQADYPQITFHQPTLRNKSELVFVETLSTGTVLDDLDSASESDLGSSEHVTSGLDEEPRDLLHTLFSAGIAIKNAVKQKPGVQWTRPPTSEEFNVTSVRNVVPQELFNLLAWIVGASEDPTLGELQEVSEQIELELLSICQDIVYLASDGYKQTPKSLALGLTAEETISGAGTTHHTNGLMVQPSTAVRSVEQNRPHREKTQGAFVMTPMILEHSHQQKRVGPKRTAQSPEADVDGHLLEEAKRLDGVYNIVKFTGVQIEPGPADVKVEPGLAGVQVEPGPADVKVEPGLAGVQVEPGPADVKVEPGPADVKVEPGLAGVQMEPGPADVKVEPGLAGVQVEPGPAGVQVETGPAGVQIELSVKQEDPETPQIKEETAELRSETPDIIISDVFSLCDAKTDHSADKPFSCPVDNKTSDIKEHPNTCFKTRGQTANSSSLLQTRTSRKKSQHKREKHFNSEDQQEHRETQGEQCGGAGGGTRGGAGVDISLDPQLHSDTENSSYTDNDENWEPPARSSTAQMETVAHMTAHTGERPYNWSVCNKTFTRTDHLNDHMTAHTGERPYSWSICKKTFTLKGTLNDHMNAHTGEKSYSCSICKKTFTRKGCLRRHMRSHTGERPYSCSVCKKTYRQKVHLRNHMTTHTGERPYSCSVCKKTYRQKVHLRNHMTTHSGERPYSCSVCKKTFAHKSHLNDHMRIHTGERPYSCSVCKKTFARKGTLNNHMHTHTGERPYSCPVCKKTFVRECNLNDHMHSHTGERPYSCSVCNKAFAHQSSLIRHNHLHRDRP